MLEMLEMNESIPLKSNDLLIHSKRLKITAKGI